MMRFDCSERLTQYQTSCERSREERTRHARKLQDAVSKVYAERQTLRTLNVVLLGDQAAWVCSVTVVGW
ncbi:MAG: hypothetical protein ACLP51_07675 [Syntrophobacteraceae bacterium]